MILFEKSVNSTHTSYVKVFQNGSKDLEIAVTPQPGQMPKKAKIRIFKISDWYTVWDSEGDTAFSEVGEKFNGKVSIFQKKEPGLYILTELLLDYEDFSESIDLNKKIIHVADMITDGHEVENRYAEIVKTRGIRRSQGIGSGQSSFVLIFFLKNCQVTTDLDLYDAILKPFGSVGAKDQSAVICNYLKEIGINDTVDSIEQTLLNSKHEPVTLLILKNILSNREDEAIAIAKSEVDLIRDILSVAKSSYGEIFAVLVNNNSTNKMRLYSTTNFYRGSIMGGQIAGEYLPSLFNALENARRKAKLKLYLALYTSAMKEVNPEFRYFRLWNILELIARNSNFVGAPLMNWQGQQIKNRKNKLRKIQDEAEEIVFELLRRVNVAKGTRWFRVVSNSAPKDIVAVWYRHRNCTTHGGGCFPNDQSYCLIGQQKYALCNAAHQVVTNNGTTSKYNALYLHALEEAVCEVINYECS